MKFFVVILNLLIHTGVSRKNNLQRKKRSKFRGPQASGRPCMRNAPHALLQHHLRFVGCQVFPVQSGNLLGTSIRLNAPSYHDNSHMENVFKSVLVRAMRIGIPSKTQREHAKCPSRCQSHHVLSQLQRAQDMRMGLSVCGLLW